MKDIFMASKNKQKGNPVKEIGGLVYTMHEGNGLESVGAEKALDVAKSKLSIFGSWISDIAPAVIKITASDGQSIKAAGYKRDYDHRDLEVTAVQLPDDRVLTFKEPIVVKFDKKNDSAKGKIKGAIENDSAISLIDAIKNHPDFENKSKDKGIIEELGKGKATLAKIVEKNDFPNLPVANTTVHQSPTLVASVKNNPAIEIG